MGLRSDFVYFLLLILYGIKRHVRLIQYMMRYTYMHAQQTDSVYIHHHFTFNFTCMTGASLMPAIVAEMQAQGYYAHACDTFLTPPYMDKLASLVDRVCVCPCLWLLVYCGRAQLFFFHL